MNKIIVTYLFTIIPLCGFSQASTIYQKGLSAEENLKAINGLGPYKTGSIGFDARYEGIKGSTRMLDTLLPSFIRLKGQDIFIQLQADIDLVNNRVVYIHPSSKKMFSIPAEEIAELIIKKDELETLFRTTSGKVFEKEMSPVRFCQILKDGNYQFIKIPHKYFVKADYKGAYSADRRYDEYKSVSKYYLLGPDSVFHQIQLNKKSLTKLYPNKKDIIQNSDGEDKYTDKEQMVLSIVSKF